MSWRQLGTILVVVMGIFTLGASPAKAQDVYHATATVNCSNYTISVGAAELDTTTTYQISWSITLTPTSGPSITVTGSTSSFSGVIAYRKTLTESLGPVTGNFSLTGTATLVGHNTIPITFSNPSASLSCPGTPPCVAPSTNTSNFNGTPINGGDYIWFNANFTASGIPKTGATVSFTSSTIQFTADKAYNLAVPNAQITFSPSATCASVSFDTLTNTFMETVPVAGSDEIFLSGLAFLVPASFVNVGGKVSGDVAWTGTFGSNVSGISINWKWGAAVYTTFTTDYNALAIKPTHQNACLYNNGDHAGTPEGIDTATGKPFKSYVTGGAGGGGGSNFTGSWSGTLSVTQFCPLP